MPKKWINALKKLVPVRYHRKSIKDVFEHFEEAERNVFKELNHVVKQHEKGAQQDVASIEKKNSMNELNNLLSKVKKYEQTAWKNISKREAELIMKRLEKMSKKVKR